MNKDQGKKADDDGDSDDSDSLKVTFEETIETIYEQLSHQLVEDIYKKKFDFMNGEVTDLK